MATIFAAVHDDIFQEVTDALAVGSGVMVDVVTNTAVLDGDGNFDYWEYGEDTVEENYGGHINLKKVGDWNVGLYTSSTARLVAIRNQAPDNKWVSINKDNIIKINTWLDNNGYASVSGDTDEEVIENAIRRFKPAFQRVMYSIRDLEE